MLIYDAVITGSFSYDGVDISSVTSSGESVNALNQFTSSYNTGSFTGSFIGNGSGLLGVVSASFASNATSASQAQNAVSASFALNATSASQAQNSNNATSASQAQNAVSSSYAANADLLDGKNSTEFAITGSNIFTGIQYNTSTSNPNGFGASASIYTDGGLRVTRDAYVSGTIYVNNLSVFGTQSINYITSSQLNISTNIISVNTDTPFVRFGGLSVYDSGSTQLTGSILWDSERDHWIYSNPSGSTYNSAMIMSGPRNSGSLGIEQGTLNNYIVKGQGGDHVTSSQIIDDGTTVRIPGNLQVTGSVVLSSALSGTSATFSGSVIAGNVIYLIGSLNNSAKIQAGKYLSIADDGFNVGIGYNSDTVPLGSKKLSVNGNLYVNGTSIIDGAATFSSTLQSNDLTIKNSANAETLDLFLSPSTFNGFIDYPSSRSLTIRNKGSLGGLTLASTGAATFSSSVTASGNLNLQGAVTRNINFYDSSNTNINAQIQYDQIASNSGQLFFGTNNAGTFATRLTIASTGAATFSSSVTAGAIISTGVSTFSRTGLVFTLNPSYGGGDVYSQLQSTGALALASGGDNNRLYITSGGNVLIGTSTSSSGIALNDLLTIGKSGSSSNALKFTDGSSSNWGFIYASASKIVNASSSDIAFETGASFTERMRITSGGTVQPGANGTQDLGTSSLRWATVFTSDLSMSNGIGDYTIVEGEEDLFLYNNKTNKVFKFLLAEVDPSIAPPKKS